MAPRSIARDALATNRSLVARTCYRRTMIRHAVVVTGLVAGCGAATDRARTPTAVERAEQRALSLDATGLRGADLTPPVTVAVLAGRVPGYRAQASVEWFESSGDEPTPVICLVRRSSACDLVLFTDRDGVVDRIRVLDPAVVGPGDVTVGQPYREVAAAVTGCTVSDGAERGMTCQLRGVTNIEAWFALGDEHARVDGEPTPAILASARVTHLWWWRPGT